MILNTSKFSKKVSSSVDGSEKSKRRISDKDKSDGNHSE